MSRFYRFIVHEEAMLVVASRTKASTVISLTNIFNAKKYAKIFTTAKAKAELGLENLAHLYRIFDEAAETADESDVAQIAILEQSNERAKLEIFHGAEPRASFIMTLDAEQYPEQDLMSALIWRLNALEETIEKYRQETYIAYAVGGRIRYAPMRTEWLYIGPDSGYIYDGQYNTGHLAALSKYGITVPEHIDTYITYQGDTATLVRRLEMVNIILDMATCAKGTITYENIVGRKVDTLVVMAAGGNYVSDTFLGIPDCQRIIFYGYPAGKRGCYPALAEKFSGSIEWHLAEPETPKAVCGKPDCADLGKPAHV